jgi:hypothetical protein
MRFFDFVKKRHCLGVHSETPRRVADANLQSAVSDETYSRYTGDCGKRSLAYKTLNPAMPAVPESAILEYSAEARSVAPAYFPSSSGFLMMCERRFFTDSITAGSVMLTSDCTACPSAACLTVIVPTKFLIIAECTFRRIRPPNPETSGHPSINPKRPFRRAILDHKVQSSAL